MSEIEQEEPFIERSKADFLTEEEIQQAQVQIAMMYPI